VGNLQANVGLDFNIKNRSGSFDVYKRVTTDLYTSIPVSSSTGITNLAIMEHYLTKV
jgi:hypothetical protein